MYAAPRRVMNSDPCRKSPLGTFKSISNPINSGAGKRTEAYCFTASICLLLMSGSWATSVASLGDQRVLQTLGPIQTHERHTKLEKGVLRERHNKTYTRGKGGWEWGE